MYKKIIILAALIILMLIPMKSSLAAISKPVSGHRFEWWYSAINAASLNEKLTGRGVKIALIDTGINRQHPDLESASITLLNHIDNNITSNKHGTAMAGIIVASPHELNGLLGVAPQAQILSIECSVNSMESIENLSRAIDLAVKNKADIINISLGTPIYSQSLYDSVKSAYSMGIIIVASAGECQSNGPLYPAHFKEVLCVGAVDKHSKPLVSEKYEGDIDVFAPGSNIVTTSNILSEGKYISVDGSSASTAMVSGIIALVKEEKPNVNTQDIKKYLAIYENKIIDCKRIVSYFENVR